jgi:putative alpha-1,2-mannosidase
LKRLYITQEDILKGGTLQFVMGSKPNKKRLGNN